MDDCRMWHRSPRENDLALYFNGKKDKRPFFDRSFFEEDEDSSKGRLYIA